MATQATSQTESTSRSSAASQAGGRGELTGKLAEIIARKRDEVAALRRLHSEESLRQAAEQSEFALRDFAAALRRDRPLSVIAEIKRSSPSAGTINADFDPIEVAATYATAGASCLSILTDEHFFGGHADILTAVRRSQEASGPPILRKDFLIDPMQVYQARMIGADAVLLIAECLDDVELRDLHQLARSLGMHTLVELYDAANLDRVLAIAPEIVGVNNRDLRTFQVDINHSRSIRSHVPAEVLFVSESGLKTRDDTAPLEAAGVDALLIGETLMRADDVAGTMRMLRGR